MLRTGIRDAEPAPTVSYPVFRTLYLPRRGVLETIFPEALRVAAALVDFVRAILDFGGAFFAGARLDFAGARFTGAALRFDAALLAPARFDRVVALGFDVFFVGAFLAATRLDFPGAFLTGAPFAPTDFLTGVLPAAG